MITFHVPGPPLPWKRTATFKGRRITPKEQREYQERMRIEFLRVRGGRSWSMSERYRVTMEVTRHDRQPFDLDNVAKNADSLNRVAWNDDSQIDELHVKRMPPSKTAPGLKVTIEVINADGGEHG